MAQFIRLNFEDDDSTDLLNRQHLATIPAGVYRGFDKDASSSLLDLVLSHAPTGYKEIKADLTETPFLGMVRTRQGVNVYEDAAITIPVTDNLAAVLPRIDLVVLEHEYTAVAGGTGAGYTVILGTNNANPVAPALTFPEKQTILGTIYWPAGGFDLGNPSVIYTKAIVPGFAGDTTTVRTIGIQTVTDRKTFQHVRGIMNALTYNSGTKTLSATVASNYYELPAQSISGYAEVTSISIPNRNVATAITIITSQRLVIKTSAGIALQLGRDQMVIEVGEVFTILDITNSTTAGATPTYMIVQGGDVHKDGINKMFGQLVQNKGVATVNTSNGQISVDYNGNYYDVNFNFATTNLGTLLGTDVYADSGIARTKGGNMVLLHIHNTGTAGLTVDIVHNAATLSVPGMKPLLSPTGSNLTVQDGALVWVIEDETAFRIIDASDSLISTPAIYTAMNAVVQNKETQWGKIQIDAWKDLGTVTLDGSGVFVITDEGNHFNASVAPFDATGIAMTDIKLKRGAALPTNAPAGTEITIRFVHNAIVTGIEPFKIDLQAGSNIRSEISDQNLIGTSPGVALHLIEGNYGITGQVIRFRKSNTKWDIVGINQYGQLGYRIKAIEDSVTAINAVPTWTNFSAFLSGFAAGSIAPRYTKLGNGNVRLSGLLLSSSTASAVNILNLPAGYRPSRIWSIPIIVDTGSGTLNTRVTIQTNGNIVLTDTAVNGASYSLDNIDFFTN